MSRRTLAMIALVLLLPGIAGCWSRRETQQMNLSTALGFDLIKESGQPEWHLTVLSSKPQGGGASGGGGNSNSGISEPQKGLTVQVTTIKGETLWDATRYWNLRAPRRLFLGQVLVIIIGEDTARSGIQQILDYLLRHQDVRERAWILVCRGKASDFLNSQPEFEPTMPQEIQGIIRHTWYRSGHTIGKDIFKVTFDLLNPGRETVLPYMQLFTPPEPSSTISQGTGNSGPQGKSFAINGSAVFRGDKMVGSLDIHETQGLVFLTNNFHAGVLPISLKGGKNNASLRLGGAKAKLKITFEQGIPKVNITIKAQADFLEEADSVFQITPQDFKSAEKAANREIESRSRMALMKSQNLNTDILGFGDMIHRSYPGEWKQLQDQWQDIYPNLEVKIKADCKIKQTGVISDPITIK